MFVEVVRLIRQGLENQEYGVNLQLQEVPRFSGDDRPREIAGFLDPYTHHSLARGNLGTDRPLVIVAKPEPHVIRGEDPTVIDTDTQGMRITIAYVTELSVVNTPEGLVEAAYTMRAMARAARSLFLNANSGDREANNIQVRDLLDIDVMPSNIPFEGIDDLVVAGAMILKVGVRDTEPTE